MAATLLRAVEKATGDIMCFPNALRLADPSPGPRCRPWTLLTASCLAFNAAVVIDATWRCSERVNF